MREKVCYSNLVKPKSNEYACILREKMSILDILRLRPKTIITLEPDPRGGVFIQAFNLFMWAILLEQQTLDQ